MNNDSKNKLKYVTEERGKWRKTIRDNVKTIVTSTDETEIKKLIAELEMSLNPLDEEDKKIISCAKNLLENKSSNSNFKKDDIDYREKLVKRTTLLLKHDWERVKVEANPMKFFPNVASWIMYMIASVVVVGLFDYMSNLKIYEVFKNHKIINFIDSDLLSLVIEFMLVILLLKIIVKLIKEYDCNIIKKFDNKIRSFFDFPIREELEEDAEMSESKKVKKDKKKYGKIIEKQIAKEEDNERVYDYLYDKIYDKYVVYLNKYDESDKIIRIEKEKNKMKMATEEVPMVLSTLSIGMTTVVAIYNLLSNYSKDNFNWYNTSFIMIIAIVGIICLFNILRYSYKRKVYILKEKVLDDLLIEIKVKNDNAEK